MGFDTELVLECCDGGEMAIFSPYSAQFVDMIKTLPRGERRWDRDDECWVANIAHRDAVLEMMQHCWPGQNIRVEE